MKRSVVEWGQILQMEQNWIQRAQQICGGPVDKDAVGIPKCSAAQTVK